MPTTKRKPSSKGAKSPTSRKKSGARTSAGATKAVRESAPHRVERAIDLLCSGVRYRSVARALATHFGITERQAEKDIAAAYDAIRAEGEATRPTRVETMRQYLWRLARKAEQAGQIKTAVSACAQLCRLDGLNSPTKIEHSGEVTAGPDLSGLSDEDADELRAIIARARAAAGDA